MIASYRYFEARPFFMPSILFLKVSLEELQHYNGQFESGVTSASVDISLDVRSWQEASTHNFIGTEGSEASSIAVITYISMC